MARPAYSDLLRDPRWQRKRLEIMERDQWRCVECGEGSTELQVHHRYYEKDREPWEYPDPSLVTLCDPCHEKAEAIRQILKRTTGMLDFDRACRVIGYVEGIVFKESVAKDPEIRMLGAHHLLGLCDAIGIDPDAAVACFAATGGVCKATALAALVKVPQGGR